MQNAAPHHSPASPSIPSSPTEIDGLIGAAVRYHRTRSGMTQQALAAACGISFQQIQKYERGTNRIAASRLVQIAHIIGLPVSNFFAPSLSESDRPEDQGLATRLLSAAMVLDETPLQHLVAIAEEIADRPETDERDEWDHRTSGKSDAAAPAPHSRQRRTMV